MIDYEQIADVPRLSAFRSKLIRIEQSTENNTLRIEELEAKRWPVAKPVDGKGGKT